MKDKTYEWKLMKNKIEILLRKMDIRLGKTIKI